MGDVRSGLANVIHDAGPLDLGEEAVTADMFGADEPGPVDGSSRELLLPVFQQHVRPRRRGRPPGARNVTTEETKRFLLNRYSHPLIGLFDVQSTPPAELAKLMVPAGERVDREALQFAWKIWLECKKEAAEYVTPKEPRQLTISKGSAPLMNVNVMTDQLTVAGVAVDQVALQLGIPETAIQSMLSDPVGREVLESEVLEHANTQGNSNA